MDALTPPALLSDSVPFAVRQSAVRQSAVHQSAAPNQTDDSINKYVEKPMIYYNNQKPLKTSLPGGAYHNRRRSSSTARGRRSSKRRTTSRKQQKRCRGSRRAK
jgi:hypothetical protein